MPGPSRPRRRALAGGLLVTLLAGSGLEAGAAAQMAVASPAAAASHRPAAARDLRLRPLAVRVPAKDRTTHRAPAPAASPATSPVRHGARALRLSTLGSGTVGRSSASPVPRVGPHSGTLATFTTRYTVGGAGYVLRMVGTDPSGPAATTVVDNTLVPVTVHVGGQTVAPSASTLTAVASSGLFADRTWPGGTGQYGDVFVRTQFWSALGAGSKAWHVELAAPQVATPLVIDVPASQGLVRTVRGVRVAFVDVDWFDARLQARATAPTPDVLTQFLAGNLVLCKPFSTDLADCGVGGYHSATLDDAGTHTYSYQAFLAATVFGPGSGFSDLGPMSHELAEWMADPFTDNAVPPWTSPLAPQYGCVDALEPGDPVVGHYLTVGGLTYQDEAYLWWFLRQSPSAGWLGRYTWLGTFSTVSPPC